MERRGPFDLIFIDADKASLPEYFQWAVLLAHEGTVIVIDNVVRKGAVLDTSGTDTSVAGRAADERTDRRRAKSERDDYSDRRHQGV